MKKLLLSIITLTVFTLTYGQKISYQKTYEEALTEAKNKHKLIFVTIAGPVPPKNFEIQGRKVNYKSGIDEPEAVDFYNKNFINYTVLITDSASTPFRIRYQTTTYPAYLFIDDNGNLVYREKGNTTLASRYITMGNNALAKSASGKTISAYATRYKLGERSADFLKEYIMLRQDMELFDNAGLADDYVDQLTIKAFQNYADVLFVLKTGPYAYGKAYNLCYTNRKIIDSIYKYEPSSVRSTINNRIITNTMNEAIKRKSVVMAQQAANFSSSTWSKQNPRQGYTSSQSQMLHYYRGVNDTASYFRQAGYYYDTYFMSISADSAKKLDMKRSENIMKTLTAQHKPDTIRTIIKGTDSTKRAISRVTIGRVVTVSNNGATTNSVSSSTANALNNAAYEFYKMGTHNPNYLTKALLWSKRSIELNPTAAYYDTEAHLLYRLNFFEEARSAENKAIDISKNETQTIINNYKTELDKIIKRQL